VAGVKDVPEREKTGSTPPESVAGARAEAMELGRVGLLVRRSAACETRLFRARAGHTARSVAHAVSLRHVWARRVS